MINIRPVLETRIRGQIANLGEVAGASSLAEILKGRLTHRGVYIYPERKTAEPNRVIGAVSQRVSVQFGIVSVVRNVRDSRGADAADVSAVLQDEIEGAMLGWLPHGNFDGFEFAGGRLVSMLGGYFIWLDSYRTVTHIRSI
ncbi:hypothetical protein NP603_21525 [Methylomonas sp. SURF-1]|uniref:Uncharacterized protein n=1 Tax=Methylomonas aurea TaxID=2952224 RepID=A0ABT1UNK0_9GAMM|nr:hypothetical protein [Methylomonas sp. SURF-1]MCQ8183702.1 hypothetical protein [Methylomonas sp. SURF-1]